MALQRRDRGRNSVRGGAAALRPFGSYLYRISGDVFLGVSVTEGGPTSLPPGSRACLPGRLRWGTSPSATGARGGLRVPGTATRRASCWTTSSPPCAFWRAGICCIYNDHLEEMIRTEADILEPAEGSRPGGDAGGLVPAIMRLAEGGTARRKHWCACPTGRADTSPQDRSSPWRAQRHRGGAGRLCAAARACSCARAGRRWG